MHIQIITYNLEGATQQDYLRLCGELAPTFAKMPGLQTKYWLADPATSTYGGVYIWANREAMDTYMTGEVAASVVAHPNLRNLVSRDFDILEAPTLVTRGLFG
jgi:Putative mono-oxygenase ydhR